MKHFFVWLRRWNGSLARVGELAATDLAANGSFEAEFEYSREWAAYPMAFACFVWSSVVASERDSASRHALQFEQAPAAGMILLDANVLLYAVNSASEHHHLARKAMVDSFAHARGVGFAWTALLAFLRLSTRAGIFERPLTIEQALQVIAHWLDQPRAHTLHPTAKHREVLRRLLLGAGTAGNLTSDAHLAALAIEHGATMLTFDRDFGRFAGLQWELPK